MGLSPVQTWGTGGLEPGYSPEDLGTLGLGKAGYTVEIKQQKSRSGADKTHRKEEEACAGPGESW